jgi:RNA polymerase primary sigma factor
MKESLKIDMNNVINTLNDREQQVLKMYYGIGRKYCLDLNEIAEEVGLTRERVRQIKEKAVRHLRMRTSSMRLRPYLG